MSKKLLLILVAGLIIVGILIFNPFKQQSNLLSPLSSQPTVKKILPSETTTEYIDPAGFTLSYPDNLSITKNEITDNSTYADIQLSSKDVSGSLNLKITDSKFKIIDEWIKLNKDAAAEQQKEVSLGNIKGTEIITKDRLLLGALDSGIFFDIEVPLIEKDYWMKVYNKVLTGFSFVAPETAAGNADSSSNDVSFESEEVVE